MAIPLATPAIPAQQPPDGTVQARTPPGKLAKAAQEFEAILLQSWLEKMNQSFIGSSDSQDPAHDTVSSLGTQSIANALAARGGIGIGAMILRQVRHTEVPNGTTAPGPLPSAK